MQATSNNVFRIALLCLLLCLAGVAPPAMAQDLIDRYSFRDTGTTVVDSVGGRNGVLHGTAAETGGRLVLDGSAGGWVSLPNNLNLGLLDATFEVWTDSYDITNGFYAPVFQLAGFEYPLDTANNGSYFLMDAGRPGGAFSAEMGLHTTPIQEQGVYTSTALGATGLHQIVVTFAGFAAPGDTGTETVYYDGKPVGQAAVTISPDSLGPTTGNTLGGPNFRSGEVFKGSLQEFRVYNGALSAAQVAADWKAGPSVVPAAAPIPAFSLIHDFPVDLPFGFPYPGLAGGATPTALLRGQDGFLYGTCSGGGDHASGTVFRVRPDGSGYRTLYMFGDTALGQEGQPAALIQAADGTLFGVSRGQSFPGTILQIQPDGTGYKILHTFGTFQPPDFVSGSDGIDPVGLTVGPDGALYGTTGIGGQFGNGTVFRMSTDGKSYKVLHSVNNGGSPAEGDQPAGRLTAAPDGYLYGSAQYGGDGGTGTLFRILPDGSGFQIIYSFTALDANNVNPDGNIPFSGVVTDGSGHLYGETRVGGPLSNGTVFSLNSDGSGFLALHAFNGLDGNNITGLILGQDSLLCGVSQAGGPKDAVSVNLGRGTLFAVGTDGSGYVTGHTFHPAGLDTLNPDGYFPQSNLVPAGDGSYYGITPNGGSGGGGTLFRWNPAAQTAPQVAVPPTAKAPVAEPAALRPRDALPLTVTFPFPGYVKAIQTSVAAPQAALTPGPGGFLYGMVNSQFVKVRPDGTGFAILYSFTADLDGMGHNGEGTNGITPVVLGADGFFYGVCYDGGTVGYGTVFRIGADGTGFKVLHTFLPKTDGAGIPVGGVTLGGDGFVYGVTLDSGLNGGYGTVYKVGTDGKSFGVLHTFTGPDGAFPATNLVLGPDGLLHGATQGGGDNDTGAIFQMGTDGSGFAVTHSFGPLDAAGHSLDGAYPETTLLLGRDGRLYGLCRDGGADGNGTVFAAGLSGSPVQVLHSFEAVRLDPTHQFFFNSDGASPSRSLVQGPDGRLYGVGPRGGDFGSGVVFSLTTGGAGFRILHEFSLVGSYQISTNADGAAPIGLMPGTDGFLYGLTNRGGPNGNGELFKLTLPPSSPSNTHVLWTNTSGQVSLWNYDMTTGRYTDLEYGPFAGWTAQAIADGGTDGLTRVLWTNTSGQMSLWGLDNTMGVYTHAEYGPFPNWTARSVSVAPDNTTHVLWTNTSGQVSIWNDDTGTGAYSHVEYGPFAGWSAQALTDSADGKTQVLWDKTDGTMSFWGLNNTTGIYSHAEYGPFPNWTALDLSAGP